MPLSLRSFIALSVLTALALAGPLHAQTFVSGHHDNNKAGPGYAASPAAGPFVITPDATFVNNVGDGFTTYGSTNVTVNGGLFAGDIDGISAAGNVVINGGNFSNNIAYGVYAGGGNTSIYGGVFGNNTDEDIFSPAVGSVITLYGTFNGYGVLPEGNGYFTGTLQNDTAAQSFHYANQGTIILAPAAVPEASATVSFGVLLMLGAGVLAVRKRHRLPKLPV